MVRKIHALVSRRAEKNGIGMVTQKDMALTQFAFVGMQLLDPVLLGIKGSQEDFECLSHYWRTLGFLLGIEDRFNICSETLDETLGRLKAVREDILRISFVDLKPKHEEYLRIALKGMQGYEPWLNIEATIFTVKRLLGVPGYNYFEDESNADSTGEKAYDKLRFYTRFRIATEVIVFERLSRLWVFRWLFNIFRLCFTGFNNLLPIFAMVKFGRKNAYVQVMKSRNKQ